MDEALCFICFWYENGNANASSNNIIFTIKETKLYVRVATLSIKRKAKVIKTS